MAVASLENLLLDELSDLLSAEKQITKALPKKVEPAVMDAALIAAAQ